jgi:hypothetical protein
VVDDPQAVRPDDAHVRRATDRGEPLLLAHAFVQSGLAVTRRVDDHPAGPECRRLLDDRLDTLAWHGDHHAVGRRFQVGQRREARPVHERLVFRVDGHHRAVEAAQVLQRAPPEIALDLRGAHHRDRARCQDAGEVAGGVDVAQGGHGRFRSPVDP